MYIKNQKTQLYYSGRISPLWVSRQFAHVYATKYGALNALYNLRAKNQTFQDALVVEE